jgi:hypothetical protein
LSSCDSLVSIQFSPKEPKRDGKEREITERERGKEEKEKRTGQLAHVHWPAGQLHEPEEVHPQSPGMLTAMVCFVLFCLVVLLVILEEF